MRSPDKSAHLGVCAAAYFVAALGLFAPRDVLHAQGRNEPALAQSIESLVARLPGRVVPLASLIDAALRDGFDAQLAVANRRRAEATATASAIALADPTNAELPQLRKTITDAAGAEETPPKRTVVNVSHALSDVATRNGSNRWHQTIVGLTVAAGNRATLYGVIDREDRTVAVDTRIGLRAAC